MITRQFEIINKTGLHARPASEFVLMAKKFESKVTIAKEGGEPVNAKSMVRLLAESIGQGCKVELAVDGPDENQAMEELAKLLESGFGE